MDNSTNKLELLENDKKNEAGNTEKVITEDTIINIDKENSMEHEEIVPEQESNRTTESYDEIVSVKEEDSRNVLEGDGENRKIELEVLISNNKEEFVDEVLISNNKEEFVDEVLISNNKEEFVDEFDAFRDESAIFKKYQLRPKTSENVIKQEKAENKIFQKPYKNRSRYDRDEKTDLQCPRCKYTCDSRTGLLNHMRIHQGMRGFSCSLCSEGFDTNLELMAHKKRPDHEQHMFLCKMCQLAFSDQLDHLLHMSTHSIGPLYRCKECPRQYNSKNGLQIHIRTHFDRRIECPKCGKSYRSEMTCQQHLKTHTAVFRCGECGKRCTTSKSLKYHMVSHTGVKLYQCVYCGKGFANNGGRKIHTRTHTDERPYECKVCHRRFHQISDLNTHTAVHRTDRPRFKCEICNKKYLQKASLVFHQRIHTKTDLFPCFECGMEFTIFPNLRSHMINMHTDSRVYGCDVCQLHFKMKCDLQRHNRSLRHRNKVYGEKLKGKKANNELDNKRSGSA